MANINSKVTDIFRKAIITALQGESDSSLSEDVQKARKDSYLCLSPIGYPVTALDIHPEQLLHSDDEEQKKEGLHRQMQLSNFLNQLPSPSTIVDLEHRAADMTITGDLLYDSYANVLRYAEPKDPKYDDEANKKAEKIREKLIKKVKKIDPFTGEVTETTESSDIVKNYLKYKNNFIEALTERGVAIEKGLYTNAANLDMYNNVLEEATRLKLETAMQQWIVDGYKNEYESVEASLADLGDRSPEVYKQKLKEALENARKSDPETNSSYYYTELFPSDFVISDKGWTQFAFDSKDFAGKKDGDSKGGGFGTNVDGTALMFFDPIVGVIGSLTKVGGNFSKESGHSNENIDMSDLYVEFKIARATIDRPWFNTSFFEMNNWKLSEEAPEKMVSEGVVDGLPSLKGMLPYYPTEVIFAKDIVIRCKDLTKSDSVIKKSISGHAGISLFGFHIGGSGKHSSYKTESSIHQEEGMLKIDGMQIIGSLIKVVPKC